MGSSFLDDGVQRAAEDTLGGAERQDFWRGEIN
jgi:hypothetical protein